MVSPKINSSLFIVSFFSTFVDFPWSLTFVQAHI